MAEANATIRVGVETGNAAAQIKALQKQMTDFNNGVVKSNESAAASQRKFNSDLIAAVEGSKKFETAIVKSGTEVDRFNTMLDKGKIGMKDFVKIGGSQVTGLRHVFKREFSLIGRVAEDRVKKMQTQYVSLGKDINGVQKTLAITPKVLDKSNPATKLALATEKARIFNRVMDMGANGMINWGKNTQWAGRQLMVGFTVPLSIFGGTASKIFMELEEQAINFRKVYGDIFTTDVEVEKNLQAVKELSAEFSKYGISAKETMDVANAAAQAGARGTDLMSQTTEATRLSVLGQMQGAEAMKTVITLQNSFKLSNDQLSESINFLNIVENQSVLSLQDVAGAIPRVAPVIKSLGGDVKDLSVMLVAMREGGVSAAEGANALKTSLARLISPSRAAIDMSNELGINLNGIVEANQGDILGAVRQLAGAMENLDELSQQRLLSEIFGARQYARIGALFNNITDEASQAARVMDLTSMSTEELAKTADKELGAVEESVATKFTGAIERLKVAIAPIGELFLKIITPFIEKGAQIFEWFNNLGDTAKTVIIGIVAVIGGIAPAILMGVGLLANFIGNAIKAVVNLRKSMQNFGAMFSKASKGTTHLASAEIEAATASAALEGAASSLTHEFLTQDQALENLIQTYRRYIEEARIAAQANPAGFTHVPNPNPVPTMGMNEGGTVPGSGNTDTQPAMLTPGEFVVNKDSAKQFGPLLEAINNGDVQGMNGGGWAGGSPIGEVFKQEAIASVDLTSLKEESKAAVREVIAAVDTSAAGAEQMLAQIASLFRDTTAGIGDLDALVKALKAKIDGVENLLNVGELAPTSAGKKSPATPGTKQAKAAVMASPQYQAEMAALSAAGYKDRGEGQLHRAHLVPKAGMEPEDWSGEKVALEQDPVNKYLGSGTSGRFGAAVDDLIAEKEKAMDGVENNYNIFLEKIQELGMTEEQALAEVEAMIQGIHPVTQQAQQTIGAVATFDVETSKMAEAQGRSVVGPGQKRKVQGYGQAEQVGIIMDTRAQTGDYSIPQTTISGDESVDMQRQQAKEAGLNVQEGMQEGLVAGQEETEQAARRSTQQIIDAVKEELGIASPSKIFKKIGDWAMEGLGQGFEEDAGAKEIAKNGARVVIAAAWEAATAEHGKRADAFKATIKADTEMVDRRNAMAADPNSPVNDPDSPWADFFEEENRPRKTTFEEERERSERARREKEFQREERQTEVHQREMDAREEQTQVIRDNTDEIDRDRKKTKKTGNVRAKMQLGMQKASGAFFGATMALDAISAGMAGLGMEMSSFQKQLLIGANSIMMFLPMLSQMPPGLSLLLLAAAGITAAFISAKIAIDNLRKDGQSLADAMVASRDDVKKVGEFYGTESLIEKEKMQRKLRDTGSTEEGIKQATEFVETTDVGKKLVLDFEKMIGDTNVNAAANALGSKLASMVLQGVIDNAQAWDLTNAITEEAGVDFIQLDVKGKLTELIGRKGEDVLTEPIEVAMRISQQNQEYVGDVVDATQNAYDAAMTQLEETGNEKALETDFWGNTARWSLMVPDWLLLEEEERSKEALEVLISSANQFGALVGQSLSNDIDNLTSAKLRLAEAEDKIKELREKNVEAIKAGKTKEQRKDILDEISALEKDFNFEEAEAGIKALEESIKASRKEATDYFNDIKDKPLLIQEMFVGMDQNLRDTFEGTGLEGTINDLINQVKDIEDQEARFDIMLSLQTGQINPVALQAIYDLFPNQQNRITRTLNMIIEVAGYEQADQLFSQLARLNIGTMRKQEILITAETSGKDELDSIIWSLNMFANMPPEINKFVTVGAFGTDQLIDLDDQFEHFMDRPDVYKHARIISAGAPGIEDLRDKLILFGQQPDEVKLAIVANIQLKANIETDLGKIYADALASGSPRAMSAYYRAKKRMEDQIRRIQENINSLVSGFTSETPETPEPEPPPVEEEPEDKGGGGEPEETPWEKWMKQIKQDNKMKAILQRLIKQGVNPQILNEMISRDDQVLEEADRRYQILLKKWRKRGKKGKKPMWNQVMDEIIGEIGERVSPTYIESTGGRKFYETIVNRLEGLQSVTAKAQLVMKGFNPRTLEGLSTLELQYLNSLTGAERKKAIKELDEINKKDVLGKAVEKAADAVRSIKEERDSFVDLMTFGIPIDQIVEGANAMGLSYYEMALMIREGTYSAAEFAGMIGEVLEIQKQMDDYAEMAKYAAMEPFERYDAIQDIKSQIAEIEAMQVRDKALKDLAARDIRDSLGAQLDTPEAIQREIDKITWNDIVPDEREIERIERLIEPLERLNELDQRQIEEKNDLIEGINEQYDAQFEALDKIEEKEQSIFDLKQGQLNIANALSRGDIAAAAQAMLDAQKQNAENQRATTRQNLEASKEAQIKKINEEIEEINDRIEKRKKTIEQYNDNIYDLEQNISKIQYDRIRPLQQQLDLYGFESGAADTIAGALALQQAQERSINGYYAARTAELRAQIDLINNANSALAQQNRIRAQQLQQAQAVQAAAAVPGVTQPGTLQQANTAAGKPVTKADVKAQQWYDSGVSQSTIQSVVNRAAAGDTGGFRAREWAIIANNIGRAATNMYGGKIKKMAYGSLVPGMGNTDRVPALLTPGEYVVRKASAAQFLPLLEAINGTLYPNISGVSGAMPKSYEDKNGGDMYNYNIEVNAGTDVSADDIANAVMTKIKMVDGRRMRGYNY